MKRLLLIPLLLLTGCMTANQLEAEKAYYQMLTAKQAQATPLVRLDVADPAKPINLKSIEVFAPPSQASVQQYAQKDYAQPWLNLVGSVMSVAVPWVGAASIVSSMKDVAGSTNYYQSVTGSGNSATIRQAGNTAVSGGITGNSNQVGGMIDNTSTPTIVEQPPPIIVNPVIVEQPAPIIVRP